MNSKNCRNLLIYLVLFTTGILIVPSISSCGKQAASPAGLDIRYRVFNLSPDLYPINLYIKFLRVNPIGQPFTFPINGFNSSEYFYVTALDTPYQFRPNNNTGQSLFTRDDVLKRGLTYTLFVTGDVKTNTVTQIFTTDTASVPRVGYGKVRFVDASPSGGTTGLDFYANDTLAFAKIAYKTATKYLELPNGDYEFKIRAAGTSPVLSDLKTTIQDGRLITVYAYGYTTRQDSAAFTADTIVNR